MNLIHEIKGVMTEQGSDAMLERPYSEDEISAALSRYNMPQLPSELHVLLKKGGAYFCPTPEFWVDTLENILDRHYYMVFEDPGELFYWRATWFPFLRSGDSSFGALVPEDDPLVAVSKGVYEHFHDGYLFRPLASDIKELLEYTVLNLRAGNVAYSELTKTLEYSRRLDDDPLFSSRHGEDWTPG